ncbi:MAG: cell division protein FtsB [Xanthomonadales bacterium]|nr:cell division protein FtsB [Xanthomonadales bacterium]
MLRWIALILLVVLVALQVKIWTGNGSMQVVDGLRASVKKQTAENQRLQQRNQAMAADVFDLKHGDQAIEARARTELGLIKPGELFYQVVESPAGAASTLPPPPPATPSSRP